jgi:hypothetical protein
MQGEHQDVGDTLIAFVLEVMFSRPESMVSQPVHDLRHGLGFLKYRYKMRIRKTPRIHGCTGIADVVHIDVASK